MSDPEALFVAPAAGGPPPDPGTVTAPDDAEPRRLDPRVIAAWRIGALTSGVFWVLAAAAAGYLLGFGWWPAAGAAAVVLLQAAFLPPVQYRHWRYAVGEVDVRIRRGWLWRTASVVLHARIQHVDTRQGPVERMFGLATVVMFTAGSVGATIPIPGLDAAEAEALRDRLADLSGSGDAV